MTMDLPIPTATASAVASTDLREPISLTVPSPETARATSLQPTRTRAESTYGPSAATTLQASSTLPEPIRLATPASSSPSKSSAQNQATSDDEQLEPPTNAKPLTRERASGFELQFCAAFLDDIERVRIATENRVRAFQDEDIDATPYLSQVEALQAIEHQATLALQRAVRRHPLGAWIKQQVGIGEKQGARLIAAIGDVTYNHLDDRPRRGVAEVWAYCGYVPGQRRQKGVKSNWNAQAKMRAFLVAESCIKQMRSPYRATYDKARASWATRDVSDGHAHNHALRLVAKAVLRDLFIAAREEEARSG